MINYSSQFQTKITEFCTINSINLNRENRWIILSDLLPWDKLTNIYAKKFNRKHGANSIDPRIIIGAFIIKHKLNISDEETLGIISENPYMQFFLGLDHYNPEYLFSPSLFVEMRKKLGKDTFYSFSEAIIRIAHPKIDNEPKRSIQVSNKGKLKIDATVADQYIRYPNDLSLVNEARIKTEGIIDKLFDLLRNELKVKPRTYRKKAHQRYLAEAKKKNKNIKQIRKTLRVLINCVGRNLGHINKMLDMLDGADFPLNKREHKFLLVIHTLYEQQKLMYDNNTHRCNDRIVSIAQPHVRPIVRGKQGKNVEFGSKLGLSLMDGFMTNETLSWDAYNENKDLIKQSKAYRALFGYYPELIQADKIYATNENRKWCKENGIRLTATPKGKPIKKTSYQKAKEKKEYAERNAIEGRIGNAKQAYSLNEIKAKLQATSQTWIAAIFFTMNIAKWLHSYNVTF